MQQSLQTSERKIVDFLIYCAKNAVLLFVFFFVCLKLLVASWGLNLACKGAPF